MPHTHVLKITHLCWKMTALERAFGSETHRATTWRRRREGTSSTVYSHLHLYVNQENTYSWIAVGEHIKTPSCNVEMLLLYILKKRPTMRDEQLSLLSLFLSWRRYIVYSVNYHVRKFNFFCVCYVLECYNLCYSCFSRAWFLETKKVQKWKCFQ